MSHIARVLKGLAFLLIPFPIDTTAILLSLVNLLHQYLKYSDKVASTAPSNTLDVEEPDESLIQ